MDGKGEFRHRDGHILAPYFKNNLFFMQDGSNATLNPFKSEAEIKSYLDRIHKFQASIEEKGT